MVSNNIYPPRRCHDFFLSWFATFEDLFDLEKEDLDFGTLRRVVTWLFEACYTSLLFFGTYNFTLFLAFWSGAWIVVLRCILCVERRSYDSITVSSTWELTSVYMRYSQGDGVHTLMSRLVLYPRVPLSTLSTLVFYCVILIYRGTVMC